MEPAGTLAEAQTTAAGQIREAAAAIFPPAFTLQPLTPLPLNCTTLFDRPTGRTQVGITVWIDGIPTNRNNDYFDALHTWWARHGWRPNTDSRPADMFTNAVSDDGYLMSLQANVHARLTMGVTTPCLPGNATPTPPSPPSASPPASPPSTAATSAPAPIPPASPSPSPNYWPAAHLELRRTA